MEESETVALSKLKESIAPADIDPSVDLGTSSEYYPFATVLRLRVLQIVFGITFLIMGTVAFIEEKGELNLGLGIPAGATIILAAAASIHTTKGFGGYRTSTCMPGSSLRFLGPSVKIALPLSILWGTACSFLAALAVQSMRTLTSPEDEMYEDEFSDASDLLVLAAIELSLSIITLFVVVTLLRIDCKYDPD